MEGTEPITLRQPPDGFKKDSLGGVDRSAPIDIAAGAGFKRNPEHYTDWTAFAVRDDREGRERLFIDRTAKGGEWITRFEIRIFPELEALSEKWGLVDQRGNEYNIQSITVASHSDRHFWIYSKRYQSRK